MVDIRIAEIGTFAIYVLDVVLLLSLVGLKTVHRRRVRQHDRRREGYLSVLSRHISYENCTDPITPRMAEDPAFLDALIDVREVLSGNELASLEAIVAEHGVTARLVRRLESRFSLGRRLRAAVALAEIGDKSAAGAMIRHLTDREPDIRIECARGLARIGWTPAIDHIVSRFAIEDTPVRARFADSLVGFGTRATWPLLAYVKVNHRSEDAGPALALRTIGRLHDLAAAEPIHMILDENPSLEMTIAAVEALGDIASPDSAQKLQSMLQDERWQVRAKSATSLGGILDTSSTPLLSMALRDESFWVRRNSAAALARAPDGIDALYRALDDFDPYAADAAAEALADVGELVAARR
ncbi:MAG TPA: HEAT repeat domain-containing protein, partial [Acidimicrobiia bacterium]